MMSIIGKAKIIIFFVFVSLFFFSGISFSLPLWIYGGDSLENVLDFAGRVIGMTEDEVKEAFNIAFIQKTDEGSKYATLTSVTKDFSGGSIEISEDLWFDESGRVSSISKSLTINTDYDATGEIISLASRDESALESVADSVEDNVYYITYKGEKYRISYHNTASDIDANVGLKMFNMFVGNSGNTYIITITISKAAPKKKEDAKKEEPDEKKNTITGRDFEEIEK